MTVLGTLPVMWQWRKYSFSSTIMKVVTPNVISPPTTIKSNNYNTKFKKTNLLFPPRLFPTLRGERVNFNCMKTHSASTASSGQFYISPETRLCRVRLLRRTLLLPTLFAAMFMGHQSEKTSRYSNENRVDPRSLSGDNLTEGGGGRQWLTRCNQSY